VNQLTVVIGVVMIAYGIYVFLLRLKNDTRKLQKFFNMKETIGEKKGSLVHLVGYVILPIIIGIVFVIMGFKGISFF
jgi:hypothetical protein